MRKPTGTFITTKSRSLWAIHYIQCISYTK